MKVRLHGQRVWGQSAPDRNFGGGEAPEWPASGVPIEGHAAHRHLEFTAGLRRVDWVRIVVDDEGNLLGAEVEGVGYRLPVSVPVPLRVATDLIVAGTPWLKCHAT
jgi:hypothetical protein